MENSEMYKKGEFNFRKLFGDAVVDNVIGNTNSFDEEFHRLLFEFCFGECWSGEGISWKQRSLNNLCLLAGLNRPHEFEVHLRGALRNGCTLAEIRDTFHQIAVYAGIPAGVECFRIAKKVFKEEGVEV